ncbi:family 43 glycosylhydrolase [Demequina sp. SYSU T00039]|uniref:Family 43 glycosylhydrolase n=1 Tax=Demequina lignilytica TaxID=3051663 RepID=A0AAW7MA99_9MICO|nr:MULTISPECIES: glycoside hydrolase family 43 protein [unclassified Demequina]MDN4478769.1 family 43 glycosylhydrolase [Demequina sp. SYSU T00039-1]MDN4489191.1 family 43 glycosylhydrolase [Demequina sp. SYSU T00039]
MRVTVIPNPVLQGFNPDPSACRVGEAYYLVTSTFEYMPGLPIYRSTDLVDWEIVGHVITRMEQGGLGDAATGGGVWAPTLRHRDGVFYCIVTIAMGRGCVVFSATDPAGPWDDGVLIEGIEGIDPDLAWDADGTAIVTYSGLVTKGEDFGTHTGIRQVDVDLATGALLSEKRSLWSGSGFMFPEAPHLVERDGWWYLFIAEGGTERGHGESVARSRDPRGGFVPGPANPFLTARSTERPVQNTGHGDLVETATGEWLMFCLGVRPRGAVRSFSALGRETFCSRIAWVDGWPTAEPIELSLRPGPEAEEIAFDGPLDAGWMAIRRTVGSVADLQARPGAITLHGEGVGMDAQSPVFVGRRQRHQTASAAVTVEADDARGGLAVRYDEATFYEVLVDASSGGTRVEARAVIPGFERTASVDVPPGPVELEIAAVRPGTAGAPEITGFVDMITSDVVRLIARAGGQEHVLAEVDGRSLSAETAGSFTGRVLGLVAVRGDVSFRGWRYEGSDT